MKKKYTAEQLLKGLEARTSEDRPWQYWLSVYWAPTPRESLALILEDPRGYQKNRTKKEVDEANSKAVEASGSRQKRRSNPRSQHRKA